MATARLFLAIVLVAAGCALLIASMSPRDELTALVLVGRHSSRPSESISTSLASSSRTLRRAHSRFSFRSSMAVSFVR